MIISNQCQVKSMNFIILIRNQAAQIKNLKSKLNSHLSTENLPHATKNNSNVATNSEFSNGQNVNEKFPILFDLFSQAENKSKNFSKETFQFANDIRLISSKCHKLLVEKINFPSNYFLNKQFDEEFSELLVNFSDISKKDKIIKLWRNANDVKGKIDATLSVDALYFHPIVTISDKLDICGMEIPEIIDIIKSKFKNCMNIPSRYSHVESFKFWFDCYYNEYRKYVNFIYFGPIVNKTNH